MRIFLVALLYLSVPHSAVGADRFDLVVGTFDASSKAARRAIAIDLQKNVDTFSAYVRYPTPQEEQWIERQRALIASAAGAAKTHQQLELYQSTPLHLAKLRSLIDNLQSSLRCVISANERQKEVACWSTAALYLTDVTTLEESIQHLVGAGEVPKEALTVSLLQTTDGLASDYLVLGRSILEYLVIPYIGHGGSRAPIRK